MKIDNVKAIVSSVATFATIGGKIAADGKVDLLDLAQLPALLGALTPLAAVKFSEIVPELKDLDANEIAVLASIFDASFDLANDSVEKKVEAGLKLVSDLANAAVAFLAAIKK